jgi:hypothetical protein
MTSAIALRAACSETSCQTAPQPWLLVRPGRILQIDAGRIDRHLDRGAGLLLPWGTSPGRRGRSGRDHGRVLALTIERKTTALIDLARCYDLKREDAGVILNLTRAERISPEDVRYHKLTHGLVRGLLKRVKPSDAGEARALATRIGLLA